MEFLDREDELALLDDHLKRPGASLFVLYGRRRIGKTALLARALERAPRAAYHVGTRSTVTEELGRLSQEVLRLDLGKAAELLLERGYEVAPTEVMVTAGKEGLQITLYLNGRLMVQPVESKEYARQVAESFYAAIEGARESA